MKKLRKLVENDQIPEEAFDEVRLTEGKFQVLPYQVAFEDGTPCFTQRVYVVGQSGCGKSRWAGNWIREYQQRYPEKEAVGICHTNLEEDIAYQDLDIDQLDLDDPEFAALCEQEVLGGGLIRDQLCLFDDIDKLDGMAKATANRLLGETIMMGRKQGIPVCFCNHLGATGHSTKDILNGATAVVVFPRGGSPGQLEYLLKRHIGFSTVACRGLHHECPAWCYIHRNYPCYVMTETLLSGMKAFEENQKEREREARRPKLVKWEEISGIPLPEETKALYRRRLRRHGR